MKKKLLFVVCNLNAGGAERVLVNLVNRINKSLFDVSVLTLYSDGVNRELLNSDIQYHCRKALCFPGISRLLRWVPARWLYRFYIGKSDADLIIAYMHGISTKVIAGAPGSQHIIMWLHSDMRTSSLPKFFSSQKSMLKHIRRFDAIVGCAQSVSDSFTKVTGITDRLHTIYNVNNVERINRLKNEEPQWPYKPDGEPVVMSVGSLGKVKGFERLMEASKRLFDEGVTFKLVILGEGPMREPLTKLAKEYKMEDRFFLPGFQKNPYSFLTGAQLFVCSSYSEGMSTATTEAVLLGIPTVSTDVSGAEEILGANNEYGIVTENSVDGLYRGMKAMLTDSALYTRYREAVQQRKEQFNPDKITRQTERLFLDILDGK